MEIHGKINEIKQRIKKKINHPFLAQNIEPPKIDEQEMRFLLSILSTQNLPYEKLEKYAMSVILIRIALDIHDLVDNSEKNTDQKGQLTVLAGDYYSGMYYYTLSNISNFDLVKCLSAGIKMVNEGKIQIYKGEILTLKDYMEKMQQIETAIYQQLAGFFEDSFWQTVSKQWLHLYQVTKNKEKYARYIFQHLGASPENETPSDSFKRIQHWLEEYITNLCKQVEETLQWMPERAEQFPYLANFHYLIEKPHVSN